MIASPYQIQPPAYSLVADLRETPRVATVRRAAPDEYECEEVLLRKLGAKGWGRVYQFKNYYSSGWGQNGKVLSPKAFNAFFKFVESATFPAGNTPSVFLTDRGGIELCWEDRDGKPVQVEFMAAGAEFYNAATDEEGVVALDAVTQLSRQLSL